MIFLNIYIFLYSNFASFLSLAFGLGRWVSDNSDDITLALGFIYLTFLFFNQKIKISKIALFILGYILIRSGILAGFALYYDYNVIAYLLPIKNWFALLFFFVIGQSLNLSFDKLNKILFTFFNLFIASSIIYYVLSLTIEMDSVFSPSRLPFLKYRIPIDIFLTTYIYTVSTIQYFSKQIPLKRYLFVIVLIILAILISQIQQMIIAIILISMFLLLSYFKRLHGSRILFYFVSVSVVAVVVMLSFYYFYTLSYQDVYFSIYRRNLLLEYVKEKILHYPIGGYPIPSPTFSDNIPNDIWFYFFDFRFDRTIYPADVPLLFILSEEGILGITYVFVLLWLCYKRNPDTKYFIYLLIATLTNFRVYYLITLVSSFTYFMLGYFTKVRRRT